MNTGRLCISVFACVASATALSGLLLVGAGCGENTTAGGFDIEDGSLRGELQVYVSDHADGTSDTRYALRAPSGIERSLLFDTDVSALNPGVQLKVWGNETPDGVRVASYRVTSPPIEEQTSALRTGAAFADRSFAFVLIDFGAGVNLTKDAAMANMVTDADSTRNYFLYASYGRQNIKVDVFGPLTHASISDCATTNTTKLANDLRAMVPTGYQHYLWYFGSKQNACSWAGLASVGTASKPSKDTWYNASYGCVVLVQEPGHNFGMQHSSSIRCPGSPLLDDTTMCTADEYGDVFDPMGGGCKHMNAWQKGYQGWFGGCNGVNVASSGTFKLLPYEMRCDGVQFLQIKAPKTRTIMRSGGGGAASTETLDYYFVELRTPLDFDGSVGGGTQLTPRVLLHIANDIVASTKRAIHPYLIDMTPGTTTGSGKGFVDSALAAGQTFTDPAGGLSITATAVSATEATITVDIAGGTAAPTCLDDSPFTAPGPGVESCETNTATPVGMPQAGTGGVAGTGTGGAVGAGSGGRAGTGGTVGTVGTGGRQGTGGTGMPGSGGAQATGGSGMIATGGVGMPGAGGSGPGTGGSAPSAGGAPGPDGGGVGIDPAVTGGCGCAVGGEEQVVVRGSLLLLAAFALAVASRPRARRAGARSRTQRRNARP